MKELIAVVDDDVEVLKFLDFVLVKAGYRVSTSSTPGRFFDSILKNKPALCLVDVQLPGMDGREIIRVLRASAETRSIPMIAMSASAVSPGDAVRGLDDGADEYFSKPLDLDLLLVRVANLLARGHGAEEPAPEIVSWGPIEIAIDEHRVTLSRKPVALTHLEMKLLMAFLRQPGRVLARTLLLQSVWDSPSASTRTVDKHVETLRRKLPPFGKKVETVVGVGYLFGPDIDSERPIRYIQAMTESALPSADRDAAKAGALAQASRELEWDYVRFQLDGLLKSGLSLLPARGGADSPRELHLELTHRCNLKCVMCEHWQMEHLDPESVKREMDFAAIRKAVEGAALLNDVSTVVITGGEPWLRHDFTDIVAWVAGALPKAEIIALTNFWNTGHLALKLRELGERGLFARGGPSRLKLGSSLDGLEATHDLVRGQAGAFAGLVRSVKTLKAEFPELSFGFTFTMIPQNAAELHDVYRFVTRELGVGFGAQWAVETAGIEPLAWTPEAREAGLRGIRRIAEDLCAAHGAAARMRAADRRDSSWLWSELLYWRYLEEYGREARRFPFFLRCTAGERHVMVGAEGEVFYCPVNRARTIGNVREGSLDEMWSSPRAAEEREYVASGKCHCWLRCVSSPAVNRLLDLALAPRG